MYVPKILIVDDNPDTLKAICYMLRPSGYELITAGSGFECLEKVNNERPDLVILDVNLPDINGYDICGQLKSNPETSHIYVLFSTAINVTSQDQTKGFQAGAEGYINQPYTRNDLIARVTPLVRLLRMEHDYASTIARLRESEQRYHSLVENSPELIAVCVQNKIKYINQAGARMLKANEASELIGRELTTFMFDDKKEAAYNRIRKSIAENQPYTIEEQYLGADKSTIYLELTVIPIEHEGLGALQLIGRDISERVRNEEILQEYSRQLEKKVEQRVEEIKEKTQRLEESQKALTYLLEDVNESREELERANLNLSALNRELESFTYSVSHDLRAPIRAIDGFSKILMEEHAHQLDEEGMRLLGVVARSASAMQRLIDDLLAFSRLGQKRPANLLIDCNAMINNIIDDITPAFGERNIEWKIGRLPEVYGDPGMIRQVFANIIGNAVKFTGLCEKAVIEIAGGLVNGETEIVVKDNGVGFDMQYAGKIFDVFQRLHDASQFEGTGIGMAIAKKIVDKHGGKIIPFGMPGKGAEFKIVLPFPE